MGIRRLACLCRILRLAAYLARNETNGIPQMGNVRDKPAKKLPWRRRVEIASRPRSAS